jgi:hypothetical protein
MPVIRMDNPNLHELVDLQMELLDGHGIPDGSIVLIGSSSHLHRVGTGAYAREWTQIVSRIGRKWPNLRVGPLVPIFREPVPGGVVREIVELGAWFSNMYEGQIHGLSPCWNLLVGILIRNSDGIVKLESGETYTVSLPVSLESSAGVAPTTFTSNCSRPSALRGLDQGQTDELLGSISNFLLTSMKISVGVNLGNAGVADGPQEPITHVIMVGASNLKRVAALLDAKGVKVTDLCVPGWVATPENVVKMKEKLVELRPGTESAVVLDLFSNSAIRYLDYDGTQARPFKMEGSKRGYHLPGRVVVCNSENLKKQIEVAGTLLESAHDSIKVIVPPAPRYLFSPCCENPSHCTNIGEESHAEKLLGETIALRSVLKKALLPRGLGRMWIVDTCYMVADVDDSTVTERLKCLKNLSSPDGVHFTVTGYNNMAENLSKSVADLQTGKVGKFRKNISAAPSLHVAGSAGGEKPSSSAARYHWHGFNSPNGS